MTDYPFDFDDGPDPLDPKGPLALWRDPAPEAVALRLADPCETAALAVLVAKVRPAAREIARILDRGDKPALAGAAVAADHRAPPRRTSLADDLIATALLLDAGCGDPTARLIVDHLRRRRGLVPLWCPSPETRRGANRTHGKRRPALEPEVAMTPLKL